MSAGRFLSLNDILDWLQFRQSRTQSPQAYWSAGGQRERLFGGNNSIIPPVSPGDHTLTKKPEDSGYEIVELLFRLFHAMVCFNYTM